MDNYVAYFQTLIIQLNIHADPNAKPGERWKPILPGYTRQKRSSMDMGISKPEKRSVCKPFPNAQAWFCYPGNAKPIGPMQYATPILFHRWRNSVWRPRKTDDKWEYVRCIMRWKALARLPNVLWKECIRSIPHRRLLETWKMLVSKSRKNERSKL